MLNNLFLSSFLDLRLQVAPRRVLVHCNNQEVGVTDARLIFIYENIISVLGVS